MCKISLLLKILEIGSIVIILISFPKPYGHCLVNGLSANIYKYRCIQIQVYVCIQIMVNGVNDIQFKRIIIYQIILKGMLLVDTKKVTFQNSYQKVLHVSTAFNNTMCFLGVKGHRKDCLTHMDVPTGKVIKQKIFTESIESFGMPSQREVMILQTRKDCITVWNLETDQTINIPFLFKAPETDQSQIFVFAETKLICIQENGRYNNESFRLSYFKYPLNIDSQPFRIFDSDEVWTYEYMIRKANNFSMVCWFKGRHDDGFEFRTFDLRDDPQGKYTIYNFPNEIHKFVPNSPKAEVAITTMWQMTPLKFMLICISSLSNNTDKVNNNYVYSAKDNSLRPALFSLGNYTDFNLDQHSFGKTCMFRTFDYEGGKPLETPIFYISNQTEQIVAQQTWKCSYIYKYDFPGFDGDLLLDCKFENGDVQWVEIQSKKIIEHKQIIADFLLQLNPNIDNSLMQQVIELTEIKKQH